MVGRSGGRLDAAAPLTSMPSPAVRSPRLTQADYALLASFRYALRKFLGFSSAAALRHGVTPQQYQVLLAIAGFSGRDGISMGELAEQLQVAHHSAVGIIDRMESLGLVRRASSREDRRRVHLALTADGRRVLEKLYRVHREELRSAGPQLIALLRQAAEPVSPRPPTSRTATAGRRSRRSTPASASILDRIDKMD